MNVLLISQCDKRALTETRRIVDQFAERRGDRTWQTSITRDGLDTLRKLLRKTARKNTAISCHWIRGLDHSELLWTVGDMRRFNAEGAVPTNTTARNILRSGSENDWHTAQDIRLLAQLAALLHDLGKASVAFQLRLREKRVERNLYRHEWVSLRLFQAFVGKDDDESWLRRMADASASDEQLWTAPGRYQRDGWDAASRYPFREIPPLAAAIGWLVVTHHRLPVVPVAKADGGQDWLGKRTHSWDSVWLEDPLSLVSHDWNEIASVATREQIEPYWNLGAPLPVVDPDWCKQAARVAKHLQELRQRRRGDWLGNPYVMHLARLSLMLADHHYSSLGLDNEDRPVAERVPYLHSEAQLAANTTRNRIGRIVLNQTLTEHLVGVHATAGLIAHALPGFERHLPRLVNHSGLRKRSLDRRFAWQDKAADAATSLRDAAREDGAFLINMASTGCGKTLANARMLYALADPQLGLRATYALGLRALTLQTGRSYRTDLHLDEDELAIRVGGAPSRKLFEYHERKAEAGGSASTQALIEEDGHVFYEGDSATHPLLSRALKDPEIRKLLSAPLLVCTIDHLAPATESLRAGRQIAPMLRLMSADLVLDELDDYGLEDLPAVTRLVHWAGLLGTRVIVSSATLPPSLVTGMYLAYRAGRRQYRRNRGANGGSDSDAIEVPCLWTDEFGVHVARCSTGTSFGEQHSHFVEKRAARLEKAEPLRRAELLQLEIPSSPSESQIHAALARHVRDACLRLHNDHAEIDPVSGKRISFGLVRMANIDPLFDVAQSLHALGAPEGTRIHLCVYHARFPLAQRSAIERLLDTTFNRRDQGAVYSLPSVRAAIDTHPEHDQLFVVLASPVCEVGRDWCADWAVVEPSSMRSLIQLAGRVQRHRGKPCMRPNMLIFDTNSRYFRRRGKDNAIYCKPGFEKSASEDASGNYRLETPWLHELLREEEYRTIDALPRIRPLAMKDWQPTRRLVDLEHARTMMAMLPIRTSRSDSSALSAPRREDAFVGWCYPQAALTGVLPQQQPFRENTLRMATLAFLPDDDHECLRLHRIESLRGPSDDKLYVEVDRSQRRDVALTSAAGVSAWGSFDLMTLIVEQAEHLGLSLEDCAKQFATVEVPDGDHGWRYHQALGLALFKG